MTPSAVIGRVTASSAMITFQRVDMLEQTVMRQDKPGRRRAVQDRDARNGHREAPGGEQHAEANGRRQHRDPQRHPPRPPLGEARYHQAGDKAADSRPGQQESRPRRVEVEVRTA
jgi:hypothetical protein